jgi:hypothetical protein
MWFGGRYVAGLGMTVPRLPSSGSAITSSGDRGTIFPFGNCTYTVSTTWLAGNGNKDVFASAIDDHPFFARDEIEDTRADRDRHHQSHKTALQWRRRHGECGITLLYHRCAVLQYFVHRGHGSCYQFALHAGSRAFVLV